MECGICYSYQLEVEIPDKICEDSRCAQPFHSSCLIEVTSKFFSLNIEYFYLCITFLRSVQGLFNDRICKII